MITRFATLTSRMAVTCAILFTMAACGGGGGGGNDGGFLPDNGPDYRINAAMTDATGAPTTKITTTSPATLTVTVTRSGNKPVPDTVVGASTDIGSILPNSGTALTNADGVAVFQVVTAGTMGAGTIEISVDNPTAGKPAFIKTVNYQVEPAPLRLGHFDQGTFIENEIGIKPDSNLVYRGSAELSIDIVDENGNRATSEEAVVITSHCLATGDATLDPVSPLQTATGNVRTAYNATLCSGDDELTATLQSNGSVAFATLSIGPPEANSLVFVSAEPDLIVLRGTGGNNRQESSVVTFKVIDAQSQPLPNVKVDFKLTTNIGGLRLHPATKFSNNDGLVSVTVQSGTVATVARVIASITSDNGSPLSTVSDTLIISTGLPDKNSISLSVGETFVVDNGFVEDGLTREITVRMADRFNNPVPDGTQALFTTEYGAIVSRCTTVDGACSVTWNSQAPRFPSLHWDAVRTIHDQNYFCPSHNGASGPCPDDLGPIRGGRSTILVTAIGEESFVDRNGNGMFDQAEADDGLFVNLPEAFLDHNEDGFYNPATEQCAKTPNAIACISGAEETFLDFNNDGRYNFNASPPLYNGLACPAEGEGVWCSRELVNVFTHTVVILADNEWEILLVSQGGGAINNNGRIYDNRKYHVYVSDKYNNRPPGGASLELTTNGDCKLAPGVITPIKIPNSAAVGAFGHFPIAVVNSQDPDANDLPPPEGSLTIALKGTSVSTSATFECVLSSSGVDYPPTP